MPKKGHKNTAETCAKISAALKGYIKTTEHRARLSAALKGDKTTAETRAKLSAANLGRKLPPRSPEHCAKLSAVRKGRYRGANGPRWKGGRRIDSLGYIQVFRPEHPLAHTTGYVMEHRLIMEVHLGRTLLPTEIVHHINGKIKDNRIENLMLFSSKSQHSKYHALYEDGGKA